MNLYTVLMVDDEDEVIQIIRRKIDWEKLGFQVIGQARNGIEALEMVEEQQPDVVMTDIKMPYMDGLELLKRIKEKYRDIRVIILSGFDEFDYAQQAIDLEAEQYLLKPIDAMEIRKVFEKTKKSLDEARDFRNNIAHLENYYQKSLPILREGFFSTLMEVNMPLETLQEAIEEYSIDLTGPYYVIAVVHTSLRSVPEGMSTRLFQLSIRDLIDNSTISERQSYIFNYRNNIVALTQFKEKEEIARFTDECDRLCKMARRSLNAMMTIGIGEMVESVQEIPLSYKSAREAVSYRSLYGAGNAININEIDPKMNHKMIIHEKDHLYDIFKQIKMGSKEDLEQEIQLYMNTLYHIDFSVQSYSITLMEILSSYYRFMGSNDIDLRILSSEHEEIYTKLRNMDSLEDIGRWLFDISEKIRMMVQEQRMNKTGSIVQSAKEFVDQNYSNPELNIDMVCSELGVSSSYFSTIFKKETGKTFINYLTEYRMKEAERLLIEEDEKKYIIAEKVGYSDPSYFSYVFKKYFGMSPVKYKNQRNS